MSKHSETDGGTRPFGGSHVWQRLQPFTDQPRFPTPPACLVCQTVIRGDNTVLVDCGDVYAVPYLQLYLMKYVARHPEAERYALDVKPAPKRAEAPAFPVVPLSQLGKIPPGKLRTLVGPCDRIPADYLTDQRRERLLKARPGAVYLFRTGDAIVLT